MILQLFGQVKNLLIQVLSVLSSPALGKDINFMRFQAKTQP